MKNKSMFASILFSSLIIVYFIKFVYQRNKEGYNSRYYHRGGFGGVYYGGGPSRENGRRGDYEHANFYYGTPGYTGGGGWTWYNPLNWYGYYYGEPLYYQDEPASCKKGCINLGNKEWGCQSLGRGWNNCWFARDCAAC